MRRKMAFRCVCTGKPQRVAISPIGRSVSFSRRQISSSNDVTDTGAVVLRIPGRSLAKARCHITDAVRTHTEVPLDIQADGTGLFSLMPDSFALIEID